MNTEDTEGGAMRPVRRTEKLVVREVGDELVAYALDTEQVTAIDPVTAQVWRQLDGSADLMDIADGSGLALADVEAAVRRLDDAGLVATGVDRRKFIRLGAVGVGAGVLLTIAAPSAAMAASATGVTFTPGCTKEPGNKPKFSTGSVNVQGVGAGDTYKIELLAGSTTNPTTPILTTNPATGPSFSGFSPPTAPSDPYYYRVRVTNSGSGTVILSSIYKAETNANTCSATAI